MDKKIMEKSISGYSLSYFVTGIATAILVVLKETSEALHDLMASMTGHHWATQGILTIILFYLLGYLFTKKDMKMDESQIVKLLVWGTIISSVIIAGFFTINWLGK